MNVQQSEQYNVREKFMKNFEENFTSLWTDQFFFFLACNKTQTICILCTDNEPASTNCIVPSVCYSCGSQSPFVLCIWRTYNDELTPVTLFIHLSNHLIHLKDIPNGFLSLDFPPKSCAHFSCSVISLCQEFALNEHSVLITRPVPTVNILFQVCYSFIYNDTE